MLILTDADVRSLLTPQLVLEAVEDGAVLYSEGHCDIPTRTRLVLSDADGEVLFMPGHVPGGRPALGLKVITSFTRNVARGLPGSPGVVLLLDPESGLTDAVVDAAYLTETRTAAMTVVACRLLARPGPIRLAIVGTGVQGAAHLDLMAETLELSDVRIWSRNQERLRAFVEAARMRRPGLPIAMGDGPAETVREADVVVAATTAVDPVVSAEWVKSGALVCGVGSHTPDAAEIDPKLVAQAGKIMVDTRRGAVAGAGDIKRPIEAGWVDADDVSELGEVIAGRRPGRTAPEEINVFKSVGFAAIDLVTAATLVELARSKGAGVAVDDRGSPTAERGG